MMLPLDAQPQLVNSTTAHLVGSLIGLDDYADLLAMLPDGFFYTDAANRERCWQAILQAVNAGERRVDALAKLTEALCG